MNARNETTKDTQIRIRCGFVAFRCNFFYFTNIRFGLSQILAVFAFKNREIKKIKRSNWGSLATLEAKRAKFCVGFTNKSN